MIDFERMEALNVAQDFFINQLRSTAEGLEVIYYLKSKEIDLGALDIFGVGYAPNSFDGLKKYFKEKNISDDHAEGSGLFAKKEESGHLYDRFRRRIIFPVKDISGNILGFSGLAIADEKTKLLNSPESPIFNKKNCLRGLYEAQRRSKEDYFIVVDGYLDLVTLSQFGINEAIEAPGTGITEEHLQIIFSLRPEVIFLFDGDLAGRMAAWRVMMTALPLLTDGRFVKFIFLPEKEDAASFVRAHGADALRSKMKNEYSLADFFVGSIIDALKIEDGIKLTMEQTLEGFDHLHTYLKKIKSEYYQEMIMQRWVDRLNELGTTNS